MNYATDQSIELFLALFALYSPIAALPSYLPVLGRLDRKDHNRLSIALLTNVLAISLVALWGGEWILHILGLSTAALSATGGIALIYESVILMLGLHKDHDKEADEGKDDGPLAASWRTVAFLPTTFPLTIGGATIGLLIAFSANAHNNAGRLGLSVAVIGYALVTGITIFLSGRIQPRLSERGLILFDRIAGILLTAIAVILLSSGFTRLVIDILHSIQN